MNTINNIDGLYNTPCLSHTITKCVSVYQPLSPQGFGRPSVLHATIVIFMEFFAWGLMTTPTFTVSGVCAPVMA